MGDFHTHDWAPIEGLEDWKSLSDPSLANLIASWHDRKSEMLNMHVYSEFLERLRREWAIETGIIERLYTLSEGATKTLIEKGLDASFIASEDTDRPIRQVIAHINDQYRALEGITQFLDAERPLGTSFIKELHCVLTAHQDTCDAIDSLGRYVQTPLDRGIWKKLPNNVHSPDGAVFEYCPPEQVDSEMERLVQLYHEYYATDVAPEVMAAWLHHRFTLIHPFQDGNGRVARCLATLVFLKAHWLPLVIKRHDRTRYVESLRTADKGDLKPLVDFFSAQQTRAAIDAMSLSETVVQEDGSLDDLLNGAAQQIRKTLETKKVRFLQVTADALYELTRERMQALVPNLNKVVGHAELGWFTQQINGPRGHQRAEFYWHEVSEAAKQLDYRPNRTACQLWTGVVITTSMRTHLLVSIHGLGCGYSGVFACLALMFSRSRGGQDFGIAANTSEEVEPLDLGASIDVTPLSSEPFTFSVRDEKEMIVGKYGKWLDACIKKGVALWADSL